MTNRHDNVVRCYGARSDESDNRQFIFLEYCAGGELFDKIGEARRSLKGRRLHSLTLCSAIPIRAQFYFFLEPEVGMPEHQAHGFFIQLLDAVVSSCFVRRSIKDHRRKDR